MNTKRVLRSLKKQLTPLIALTMVLIGAASIAAATQLFLLGLPAASAAAIFAGAGVVLLTWKIQVTSVTSKELQRQLKLMSAVRTVPVPPAVPVTVVETPPPTPERSVEEKLRVIGTYSPPASAPRGAKGRLAATVAPDPDAAFRLFAATNGFGAPEASAVSRRAIALVGSDKLAEALTEYGSVHRLHPSVSAAEMEHAQPSALIVEEDALSAGPWAGALDPQGARLLLELRVAMAWMRRNTGSIYVVAALHIKPVSADAMRADTIVIDDDFLAEQSPDAPKSLATALTKHRRQARTA